MENRLGADLSGVKVYQGGDSATAASAIGAKAFTIGSDVHFNAGQFAPGTKEGDRLLAHELTHVVQGQRGGVQRKAEVGEDKAEQAEVSEPHEPAEQEADNVADHVADDIHGAGGGRAGSDDATASGKDAKASGKNDSTAERPEAKPSNKSPGAAKLSAPISAKLDGGGTLYRAAASSNAAQTPSPKAELRKKIEKERDGMQSASSLSTLGGKIASTAKPGDAPTKISNTVNSAERARSFFDKQGTEDAKKRKAAFVENRMGPALSDQKEGVKKAQDAMLQKQDAEIEEVDYGRAQGGAVFGPNKGIVLAPENIDEKDSDATRTAVKKKGGLAKVVGLGTFWNAMNDSLKKLWVQAYGDDKTAKAEWSKQARAAEKPVTQPSSPGAVPATKFAPFSDPASAFTGTLVGAMGLLQEYDDIKCFQDAYDKLGLNPAWYDGGFGFLVVIPSDNIDKATGAGDKNGGKDPKLNIGKPSLFSSLAFAEFNYIVEDRATNTTAMDDTTNSGVVDPRGKTEVTVNNISYSELFSQPVRVLK
jgi:hypothetical protein